MDRIGASPGVMKIDDFHQTYLSPLLFRYKLGAKLDFGFRILELRNSVYYKLIERSDSTNPKSAIMTNDSIGIKTG